MPIVRTYECPECKQTFDHLHLKRDEPPPDYCDLCNAWVGDGDEPMRSVPTAAALNGSVMAKSAEQVLKAQEASYEAKAELAAGKAPGVSASEMVSALRDAANQKLSTAQQPIAQAATQLSHSAGGQQLGARLAQGTRVGPYANQGSRVAQTITQGHGTMAAQLARAGQMGKH